MNKDILAIVHKIADKYGIPKQLLKAMVLVESGGNPWAIRYEDHYRWLYHPEKIAKEIKIPVYTEVMQQKTSWGCMQVMGAVARELGCKYPYLSQLCNPEIGIDLGAQHLKRYYEKYGNWEEAIVSYNAGAPRKHPDGSYKNQQYLEKVLQHWR